MLLAAGFEEDEIEPRDCAEPLLTRVLSVAFDQFMDGAVGNGGDGSLPFLRKESVPLNHSDSEQAFQVLMDQLRFCQPRQIWQCSVTGTLWAHSVLGKVPLKGSGELIRISQDVLDGGPRWGRIRRELVGSSVWLEGLWADEHSAQLDPKENRRLQDLFKIGVRNILSSTTTMELGIDIGGLNGVMLGNVPPGLANHRQRAGRAGRRADGSSIVVTYAGRRPYDQAVFKRFDVFLGKEFRKPTVFLDRERITRRHLHAFIFGEFMRSLQGDDEVGAMDAFGTMGRMCGRQVPARWRDAERKPAWQQESVPGESCSVSDSFCEYLTSLGREDFLDTGAEGMEDALSLLLRGLGYPSPRDDADWWRRFLHEMLECFAPIIGKWETEWEGLANAWNDVPESPEADSRDQCKRQANAIAFQLSIRANETVIAYLADNRFLPRYGFPVNLLKLKVLDPSLGGTMWSDHDGKFRLQRQSVLALSEYAPGAKVLVGGRVAISRGVVKDWTGDGAAGRIEQIKRCPNNHDFFAVGSASDLCPECQEVAIGGTRSLFFPLSGFATAAWEPMRASRAALNREKVEIYPTDFAHSRPTQEMNDFGGIAGLTAEYYEEAQMLVQNNGSKHGFAICTSCGFAGREKGTGDGAVNLPTGFAHHHSLWKKSRRGRRCWPDGSAPVLRNVTLAARENTDMLLLHWPLATPLIGSAEKGKRALLSLGRALVRAAAERLEIDERELQVWLKPTDRGNWAIMIYDANSGGSGHCRELFDSSQASTWFDAAREILVGTEEHNRTCLSRCIECILDFSGQYLAGDLDRHLGLQLLDGDAITNHQLPGHTA